MVASKDKIKKWEVAHNNTNNFQFLFLAFKTHVPKLPSVVGVFACICIVYADIRKYRDSHHLPGDGTLRNARLLFNEPFPLVSCIIAHAVVRGIVCFMLTGGRSNRCGDQAETSCRGDKNTDVS